MVSELRTRLRIFGIAISVIYTVTFYGVTECYGILLRTRCVDSQNVWVTRTIGFEDLDCNYACGYCQGQQREVSIGIGIDACPPPTAHRALPTKTSELAP
jgi:hypothetical protein